MEQRTLVKWLKILVLFAAVCGLGPVSYTHLGCRLERNRMLRYGKRRKLLSGIWQTV